MHWLSRSMKPTAESSNSKPRFPITSSRTIRNFIALRRIRRISGARSIIWNGGRRNQGGHHGHKLENVSDGICAGFVGRVRLGVLQRQGGLSRQGAVGGTQCRLTGRVGGGTVQG